MQDLQESLASRCSLCRADGSQHDRVEPINLALWLKNIYKMVFSEHIFLQAELTAGIFHLKGNFFKPLLLETEESFSV